MRIVKEVHASDINTVDWSCQDENLIATGSNDTTVKILDIRYLPSGQSDHASAAKSAVICTLRGHKAKVQSVKFSPFSSRYLASSGDSLILWDVKAGNLKPEDDAEEIK